MSDILKKIKKLLGAETEETTGTAQPLNPAPAGLPPAPRKREEIIRFIIHALGPYINERRTGIKGIRLYLLVHSREEENLVNIALYADKPGAFKTEELDRRFSDHYITPDTGWYFEFKLFHEKLPECTIAKESMGLDIVKDSSLRGSLTIAAVRILSGQAESEEYLLDPSVKLKYKIGRGKTPVLPSGMMHTNDIVFLAKEEPGFNDLMGSANLTVSRYHATIRFNPQKNRYFISAETGGTPAGANKTKLFSENGRMIRLEIPGAQHELTDGDQVELGGSARLLFREQQ